MERKIIAYSMQRGLSMFTPEDMQILTHVNFAFGLIRDGLLSLDGLPDLKKTVEHLRNMNPKVRLVLSIGGWGAGGFSLMSRTAEGRERFSASVLDAVREYGLDGADIDWEYPCSDAAGIDSDPGDRERFTELLESLREKLGTGRILSIAAGGSRGFIRDTEMDKVARICDYVQIMTYDLRCGFDCEAGHHTSLYPTSGDSSERNVHSCVRMFHETGVPLDRMVIGAAFYGRRWDGVENRNHGLCQKARTSGEGGGTYTQITENLMGHDGFVRYWDEQACAPYLFNGSSLISYDDECSVRCKCRYILEQGLSGIMFWEYRGDERHRLVRVMGDTLKQA